MERFALPSIISFTFFLESLQTFLKLFCLGRKTPPSGPSGDTRKPVALPTAFGGKMTRERSGLNVANRVFQDASQLTFYWCGDIRPDARASFHPSGLGKAARHENLTKKHENTTLFASTTVSLHQKLCHTRPKTASDREANHHHLNRSACAIPVASSRRSS